MFDSIFTMDRKRYAIIITATVVIVFCILYDHVIDDIHLRSIYKHIMTLNKPGKRILNVYENVTYFEANLKVPSVCSIVNGDERAPWSFVTTQKTPRYNCSHFMTSSGHTGRIGNMMFQVSGVIGTAHKHGYTPVLRSDHPLFTVFDMMDTNENNVKLSNVQGQGESSACRYSIQFEHLSHSKNWSLSTYLQSWKYFTGAEEKIRYAFRFKKDRIEKLESFFNRTFKKKGFINIGIHVRRGDFASDYLLNLGYTVAPPSYFHVSTEYFRRKYKNVQFIVTSDDINWCRENLGNITNINFSSFTEPEMDMALLSICDHVIITSGSFGWWSAWLSGGTVVYYKNFPKPNSWLDKQFNSTDYYPVGWIGMQ